MNDEKCYVEQAELTRLQAIEAAMREWHEANEADDLDRWLNACKKMNALMGGTWKDDEPDTHSPMGECLTYCQMEEPNV